MLVYRLVRLVSRYPRYGSFTPGSGLCSASTSAVHGLSRNAGCAEGSNASLATAAVPWVSLLTWS